MYPLFTDLLSDYINARADATGDGLDDEAKFAAFEKARLALNTCVHGIALEA